ncbi:MAG: hypothetical protein NWF01_04065 [Candidatus Bathyarchaeota archaeon]|nr:hypothetical protein [Candidatus Bathyarchaeota archaeon]
MEKTQFLNTPKYAPELDNAKTYAQIWNIVKDTAEYALSKRRGNLMLFLEDLPLQLGAYYPVGTNNIVLNRALVDIVEAQIKTKPTINALIYNLLLHEYLHALGEMSEKEVRHQVIEVAKKSFGENHIATELACKSPWILLKDLPLESVVAPKRVMEIVSDFEKTSGYIV